MRMSFFHLQRRSLAPSTAAKRLVDTSDYEDDSDDYDDDEGSKRNGKRKRNEKPKKVRQVQNISLKTSIFSYVLGLCQCENFK